MELERVESHKIFPLIESTLKTILNGDEMNELLDGFQVEVDDGSLVYSINHESESVGFIMVTPLADEELDHPKIELISVEDIWIKSGVEPERIADHLAIELKNLSRDLQVPQIEVIVSQQISWLNDSLQEQGFIVSEVKLEKLLPRVSNLEDVLDLIRDSTPIYRIVQVLLEKDEQFIAEFVESVEEIDELLEAGWSPIMVIVTFEPDGQNIDDVIKESNSLINWDDYSVVYYI